MWDNTDPTETSAPPEPMRPRDRVILVLAAIALLCGWAMAGAWAGVA